MHCFFWCMLVYFYHTIYKVEVHFGSNLLKIEIPNKLSRYHLRILLRNLIVIRYYTIFTRFIIQVIVSFRLLKIIKCSYNMVQDEQIR